MLIRVLCFDSNTYHILLLVCEKSDKSNNKNSQKILFIISIYEFDKVNGADTQAIVSCYPLGNRFSSHSMHILHKWHIVTHHIKIHASIHTLMLTFAVMILTKFALKSNFSLIDISAYFTYMCCVYERSCSNKKVFIYH